MKRTLVIGVSTNPQRYSYKAINMLVNHGHEVIAVGIKKGEIRGIPIQFEMPNENIHTITLYINPSLQNGYYDAILALKPQRIIFNPGTENQELKTLAEQAGIETRDACTLVMLAADSY